MSNSIAQRTPNNIDSLSITVTCPPTTLQTRSNGELGNNMLIQTSRLNHFGAEHLILIDPRNGREIWAGSALPAPLLTLGIEDVDGDGRNEVRTLEGSYTGGGSTHLDVWRWNGFGFTLEQRSPVDSEFRF